MKLDIERMREGATEATAILRVLANPDRLLLLCQLTHGEHSVSELEESLGIQQPTLSQQLGVLRSEGLVDTRRDGKRIYYEVSDLRVSRLLDLLYQEFCRTRGRAAK